MYLLTVHRVYLCSKYYGSICILVIMNIKEQRCIRINHSLVILST